jgi:amino acid adenylation domain-containing protein/non-ribosomal peptide synthase protein (TIGR01720 family)
MENLLKVLKENNISVSLDKNDLKVKFNGKNLPVQIMQQLKDNKAALVTYLTGLNAGEHQQAITPAAISAHYPLSSAQRRLWILSQIREGNVAYNMPGVYVFEGNLNTASLEYAFNSLIMRHESLRTIFREDEQGDIRQFILAPEKSGFSLSLRDLRNENEQDALVKELVIEEATCPFNLATGPLLRAGLLQVADNRWIFTYNMHHIMSDGWSMNILMKELMLFYTTSVQGIPDSLAPLRIHYKDYAAWQQRQLTGEKLEQHRSYWLRQFEGELPTLNLHTDKIRPALKTYNGHAISKTINSRISRGVKSLVQEQNSTLFMGLIAAVNTLLYRYTSQEDTVIGSPIAGRDHPDLEDQIGFYLNMLALRTQFSGTDSFKELLQRVKQLTMNAYDHQVYPLDELIAELNLDRDMSRNALFDVAVILQNNEKEYTKKSNHSEALALSEYSGGSHKISKFDLSFYFVEKGDEIQVRLEYNTDLYTYPTIVRMMSHFEQILDAIVTTPTIPIRKLDYLTPEEKQELVVTFNGDPVGYPAEKTILDLFEEQVGKTPDHVAVSFEGTQLTYKELNKSATQLGHYLRSKGVKEETMVPVCIERSLEMIVSLLGILKAGGAYIPLDPTYPEDRIQYALQDTGAKVVVCSSSSSHLFPGTDCVVIDTDWAQISEQPVEDIPVFRSPDHIAYVIYTSGTTGRPKGVLIEHKNVVRLFETDRPLYDFNSSDVWTMFHSFCFDFSVWEMYGALFYGGRLVIVSKSVAVDVQLFGDLLIKERVTVLNQTPSFFYVLQDYLTTHKTTNDIRYIIYGGEALNPQRLKPWRALYPWTRLINMYGITETTVHVTYQELSDEHLNKSSSIIGRAIPTLSIYILDSHQQLVPIGVTGELYVGGSGVGRGYLNREELTAQRFIANPFVAGERLYRSGDLARWYPDGNVEYLNRIDNQVKIRGYRIELGEIESVLQAHENIDGAVVLARTNRDSNKDLVAYFVSKENLSVPDLRYHLSKTLPSYMIPTHFVQLAALPLNANGKTDKTKLPDPEGLEVQLGVEYIAARNEKEQHLIAVFEDVLKKQPIGIKDDFFALGGDSIKSIQIASRLKQRGFSLTIGEILKLPVIEQLADKMEVVLRTISQQEVAGIVPFTPIQAAFFEEDMMHRHHFNQSVLLKTKEPLNETALAAALNKIMQHHDALRMVYEQTTQGWQQENKSISLLYAMEVISLVEGDNFAAHCQRIQTGMDLSKGPLFKAVLFKSTTTGDRLLLVAHHLVIDGVSWRIIFEDLSSLYQQSLVGQPLTLPGKTDSFRYWQEQQVAYSTSETLRKEQAYWSAIESKSIDVQPLPLDHVKGSNLMKDMAVVSIVMEEDITAQLLTRCYKAYHTEVNDILLTTFGRAVQQVFNIDRVLIGLEGHGREYIGGDTDVTRTVGWFTSMYPVLLDMRYGQEDIRQLIAVKESLHRVPNKGIGYGILRYLGGQDYQLRPEIVFNYLGDFGSGIQSALGETLFSFSGEAHGDDISPNINRNSKLDVSGRVVDGKLTLIIGYSRQQFNMATIQALMDTYELRLFQLVEQLSATDHTSVTPVDLTYNELSIDQVLELQSGCEVEDVYTLSPLQEGLYYHWLASPGSPVYFEETSYRLNGQLDLHAIEQSYRMLVARHAVLRTFFTQDYSEDLLQVVRRDSVADFEIRDVSGDKDFVLADFKKSDRARGFDLHAGPLVRLTVLLLGNNTCEFVWSHHHILMDGWCSSILVKEFFWMYHSLAQGRTPELEKVNPYSAYIKWLHHTDKADTLRYWEEYLSGYDTLSGLPTVNATGKPAYKARQCNFAIDGPLRQSIRTLCTETGITENIFIQTAWSILLGRYNNTNDVVFGAVVSGRPAQLEGVEEMIGLFINTIPVRIGFNETATIREVLKQVQQNSIAGLDHHYAQLANIHALTSLGRNLFDHIVIFENYPVQEIVKESVENTGQQKQLSMLSSGSFEQSNYDFMFTIVPGENLLLKFSYNANVYGEQQMEKVMQHLVQILDAIVTTPTIPICKLDYLTPEEKQELVVTFNGDPVGYPAEKTILDLFEEQVGKTPDHVAVSFEGTQLTYKELNKSATQLGHYLRSKGVKEETMVPVCIERSLEMIVSLLGILKAGGAYIPLDPTYPEDRIQYALQDTGAKVVVCSSSSSHLFPGTDCVVIDTDWAQISEQPVEDIPVFRSPDHIAYVIYTSGTTGRPKGVLIEHKNVVRLFETDRPLYDFNSSDVWTMFHSFCFDFSVWEMYGALFYGGRLVIVSKSVAVDVQLFGDLLIKERVTVLNQTPSFFYVLQDYLTTHKTTNDIRYIIYGGEALNPQRLKPWRALYPWTRLINMYGITETTVHVTYQELSDEHLNKSSSIIGRAIPTLSIYILDSHQQLVPIGVTGELYVGGSGVGRGYLNREELTAQRFIANPFVAGERLYRSGDLARWYPDGNVEYLNRIDNQVKIRGYRIELGEIETALLKQPGITAAVVTVKVNRDGDKDLVAYIVGTQVYTAADLRTALGNTLPEFMVPGYYVQLDAMPLSANGKLDRKKLPDPEGMSLSGSREYVAPANEVEEQLVKIWQDLLDREKVGVRDNFFEIGGNSIKIIRLSKMLSKALDKDISIALLFQYANIADFVDYITKESVTYEVTDFDGDELAEDLDKFNFM